MAKVQGGSEDRSFPRYLTNQRARRLLTVREFAEGCGISPSLVSRMELHGDVPKVDVIIKMARYLGTSTIELLGQVYPTDFSDIAVLAQLYHSLDDQGRDNLLNYGRQLVATANGGVHVED